MKGIGQEDQERQERVVRRLVHELMNPIGSMSLAVESLQMEFPDNETVGILSKSVDRLTRLIKSYAHAIRKPELILIKESLSEIVLNTLESLDNNINIRKSLVETRFADNGTPVLADKMKLQEALMHILINALEASKFQKGHIRISTSVNNEGNVILSVKNDGNLIDEAFLNQIFDPLFTTKNGHLGLGLNVAEGIILAHNGSIHVSNVPQQGVEVTIVLIPAS